MRTEATASPDVNAIDAVTLWGTIGRSLPWMALWTLAVLGITFGVLTLIAPRYQSEAQLTIDAKTTNNPFSDPKQAATGADSTASQMDREAINTHIKSLQSPTLAAEIVKQLKLKDKVEFNSELGDLDLLSKGLRLIGLGGTRAGQSEQDRLLEAYFKNLDVYSARESRFIGLRFMSTDPQLAADIPNALAEAYRVQLAGRKVEETKDVQDALLPKIEQLTKDVAIAEVAVEQFRGKADSFNTGAQKQTLNEQQLGELTNELSKAQASRSESEARARSAADMLRGGSGEVLPDVQKSPLIQNLVQQRVRAERQVAEVSASLLPGHPRMQQLNADLAGLKKQITAEVSKIVDGLGKEAKLDGEREIAIKKRLSDLKVTVVNAGPDEAKLKMFVSDAKSKREELERLQAQYNVNKTRAESKAVPVEAKILSLATPSSVAIFPKKGAVTAIAGLAAFVVALALTVLKAIATGARPQGAAKPVAPSGGASGNGRHNRREFDMPDLAPQPMAAAPMAARAAVPMATEALVAPVTATKNPRAEPIATASSTAMETPFAAVDVLSEGLSLSSPEALAGHILSKTPERGGYRTLITGSAAAAGFGSGSDAAAVAITLAKSLADAGQPAVLVEWTYDVPRVSPLIGAKPASGMAELVSGAATFEDVIASLENSECHFIAAGQGLADVSTSLDPDQLNLVLDALDEAYAHIVVVGDQDSVRHLFEVIQGRFDAGVVVTSGESVVLRDPPGTFLGFEVAEIDLIRLVPAPPAAKDDTVQRRFRGVGGSPRLPVPA